MRLAILADIHGNIPALEAALSEIERDAVDGILVAGDMVAGPNSVEVLRRLRALGASMIRGNNENYILRLANGDAPDWQHHARQWAFMRWNYQQMDSDSLSFIRDLPEQRTLTFDGTDPIRMVHGSPRNVSELVYPDQDMSRLETTLEMVSEPVLIFGHTHVSWQLRLGGRLALNPGSVCGAFNGQTGGSYAILTWDGARWDVELRELHYDLSLIRQAFEQTGLLAASGPIGECWLHDLEHGVNTLPRFVDFAYEQSAQAGHANLPYVPDEIWDATYELFKSKMENDNIAE